MQNFVLTLHCDVGWLVVFLNAVAGAWALLSLKFWRLDHPSLGGTTVAVRVISLFQVLLGLTLRFGFGVGVANLHVFYGVVTVVFIAVAFIYAKGSEWVIEHRWAFEGLFSLFLMGVAIRAIMQVPNACSPF